MTSQEALFWTLLLPLSGTVLGSAFVFLVKDKINARFQKTLLGFAAGIMVAASVWSLLLPAMEMQQEQGGIPIVPAVIGLLAGFLLLYFLDMVTPHIHVGSDVSEGPRSKLSKTGKLALAMTIHNLPEGMAVGVVLGSALDASSPLLTTSAALAVAIGMAIQNIPEGAIVAMPMRSAGSSRLKSFAIGSLSGVVEPLGTLLTLWLTFIIGPALPYLLALAAGAMLYVVVEELIPEGSQGAHSNLATLGFAVGFVIMMTLDSVLG